MNILQETAKHFEPKKTPKDERAEILNDIKCDVEDEMGDVWFSKCQSYVFPAEDDYAPYGDTFVSTGRYITDEADQEFREDFEKNFDFELFCDRLKYNPSFKESVMKLAEQYAWSEELKV